jgi:murein DD-endopeptidase
VPELLVSSQWPRSVRPIGSRVRLACIASLAMLLVACSSLRAPPPSFNPAAGAAIVSAAAAMVGTPYHFGGADQAGFDCSGLALYVHERLGLSIPRTAAAQQRAARPVPLSALEPGDLVFFRVHAHSIDHVGIYVGDGRFIHAPHAGVNVSYATLASGFYAHHLVSAGRFW